eukprot:TRINITY_DN9584_c0_g1_i2.p1 TRINITY_DN9584_c0_g1~~TRINITY_DN9584_c0_g1_i2.p1  ORF type:complete len:1172 (+),score=246.40 TRINITY_DN9584_c0_g1_i2:64-3579(+)
MNNFKTLREFVENAIQLKILQTEMFGVDIESFMKLQRAHVKFLKVPWVVRLCADEMIRRGFGLEGIFRVPGGHDCITNICKAFNNGEVPDFSADEIGLEEVSGVFKKYLRELPEPLLKDDTQHGELHAQFCSVLSLSSEAEQVERLKILVPRLSEHRRALAKEIFFVLHLVSMESEANLMDSMNLATIFGGMVDIISDTLFADEKKMLCWLLIEFYPEIFSEVDKLVKPPQEEMTDEQKEAKVVISVFLDNGTHRTFWIKGGDTSAHVRGMLFNKLQAQLPITDKWDLFEVSDREVRQLELQELVAPLVKAGRSIVFSGNFDLEELKIPRHASLANMLNNSNNNSNNNYIINNSNNNDNNDNNDDNDNNGNTDNNENKINDDKDKSNQDNNSENPVSNPEFHLNLHPVSTVPAHEFHAGACTQRERSTEPRDSSDFKREFKRSLSADSLPVAAEATPTIAVVELPKTGVKRAKPSAENKSKRKSRAKIDPQLSTPDDAPVSVPAATPVGEAPKVDAEAANQLIKEKLAMFIEKEEEYRAQMEIISAFYKEPMRKTTAITAEQYSCLFGHFDGIFLLHQQMKQRLTVDNVGNVVFGMLSYFKMYGQVRGGKISQRKTLSKIMKDGSKSANLIEKCKKESKSDKNLAELLWAMQRRLKEYEASLLEIVQACPEGYAQARHLMEAYKGICALNASIQDQMEIAKTGYILYKLQKRFVNLPQEVGFQLITPTRRILRQSAGQVKAGENLISPCQVILFNDSILVYSPINDMPSPPTKKIKNHFAETRKLITKGLKKTELEQKISFEFLLYINDMEGARVVNDDTEFVGEDKHLIVAHTAPTTGNITLYRFLVPSPEEWQVTVEGAITILQESKQTFISFQKKQDDRTRRASVAPGIVMASPVNTRRLTISNPSSSSDANSSPNKLTAEQRSRSRDRIRSEGDARGRSPGKALPAVPPKKSRTRSSSPLTASQSEPMLRSDSSPGVSTPTPGISTPVNSNSGTPGSSTPSAKNSGTVTPAGPQDVDTESGIVEDSPQTEDVTITLISLGSEAGTENPAENTGPEQESQPQEPGQDAVQPSSVHLSLSTTGLASPEQSRPKSPRLFPNGLPKQENETPRSSKFKPTRQKSHRVKEEGEKEKGGASESLMGALKHFHIKKVDNSEAKKTEREGKSKNK